jgi:hypothetical protein
MNRQPRRVPCISEVNQHVINMSLANCPYQCNNCRHLVQRAKLFATEMPAHARSNCRIEINTDHFTDIYWSDTGYQENRFVFQMVNGQIFITTQGESWKTWAERWIQKLWNASTEIVLRRLESSSIGS